MQITVQDKTIKLIQGDITEQQTDAIVNAANSQLQLGAGVAGAIRSKGGKLIQQECDRIGGTPVGTAVITGAGDLNTSYVIHAVGPRMGEGDEDSKLAGAIRGSLELAAENRLQNISLPAISTGIFGFPIERAARVMLMETRQFLRQPSSLEEVVFCLFSADDYQVFADALNDL